MKLLSYWVNILKFWKRICDFSFETFFVILWYIFEFHPKINIYYSKFAINHSNCDFLLHLNLYRNTNVRKNEPRCAGYRHYCSSCCCNNVVGALFSESVLLFVVTKRFSFFRWKCILSSKKTILMSFVWIINSQQ